MSKANGIEIAYVGTDKLKPADYNPRQMSDEAFARLKRGIEEFGLVDPLVVRRKDRLVIGGHQRLRAAQELGIEQVPVVYLNRLTDERAATLNVLLNNPSAQGEWDMPKLADLLSELDGNGWDATLTGFDGKDLEDILTWTPDEIEDEGDVDLTPPKKPKSKRGEIYELGPHRLMCGDATADTDVLELMGGTPGKLLLTDPPYGVGFVSRVGRWGAGGKRGGGGLEGDNAEDAIALYGRVRELTVNHTESRGLVFCPGGNNPELLCVLWEALGADKVLVWDKGYVGRNVGWRQSWEAVAVVGNAEPSDADHRDVLSGYLSGPYMYAQDKHAYEHPTAKPIKLFADLLAAVTEKDDIILDPFAGSGTTIIAAEQLSRTCYAMEIEPAYCDVIRRRYAEFVNDPKLAP